MSDLHNGSSARRTDYVWQYEYYEDEEPVSVEGHDTHRYSIVIGFWVGLAVFVIFMFFVLTLLTKTGAPHQGKPDSAVKRRRPGSCLVDVDGPQEENDQAFSRPLLAASRLFSHRIVGGEQRAQDERVEKHIGAHERRGTSNRARGLSSSGMGEMEEDVEAAAGRQPPEAPMKERESDEEGSASASSSSHFNIPNFVNVEQSSTVGEEDLLNGPAVSPGSCSQGVDMAGSV